MMSPDHADGATGTRSTTNLGGIAAPLDRSDRPPLGSDVRRRPQSGNPARLDQRARRGAATLLVVILVAIAVIVFWPGPPDPGGQSALHDYLERAHRHGLPSWITFDFIQNAANVFMFVPLGLLGSLALRRHNYLVVLYAAAASGFIELTQLVLLPHRVASLQDVMANTGGALLGFLISLPALRRRIRRRRRYLAGRSAAADSPRRVARATRL
ncbi:VanZ family protein [Nakamurella sp. UYEF19]|uniref:VanZ family protein n=1 Tax=Nakamurella sp. UYEF19 TaxID=1756392 RepID=UPI0033925C89